MCGGTPGRPSGLRKSWPCRRRSSVQEQREDGAEDHDRLRVALPVLLAPGVGADEPVEAALERAEPEAAREAALGRVDTGHVEAEREPEDDEDDGVEDDLADPRSRSPELSPRNSAYRGTRRRRARREPEEVRGAHSDAVEEIDEAERDEKHATPITIRGEVEHRLTYQVALDQGRTRTVPSSLPSTHAHCRRGGASVAVGARRTTRGGADRVGQVDDGWPREPAMRSRSSGRRGDPRQGRVVRAASTPTLQASGRAHGACAGRGSRPRLEVEDRQLRVSAAVSSTPARSSRGVAAVGRRARIRRRCVLYHVVLPGGGVADIAACRRA